jgi:hypothetical protein
MATDPLRRIAQLVRRSIDGPDDRWHQEACHTEVVRLLVTHPELDPDFLDAYVTRPSDEWELNRGLRILALLGEHRGYEHAPVLALLDRADVAIGYKRAAISCLAGLADRLDERVLTDLIDRTEAPLRWAVVDSTVGALAGMTDREKAVELLHRCVRATETTDERGQGMYLDAFVSRVSGCEDLYERVLARRLEPHEEVVLTVSLLGETLPTTSPFRVQAERAAGRSSLAADYFRLYVTTYIT